MFDKFPITDLGRGGVSPARDGGAQVAPGRYSSAREAPPLKEEEDSEVVKYFCTTKPLQSRYFCVTVFSTRNKGAEHEPEIGAS